MTKRQAVTNRIDQPPDQPSPPPCEACSGDGGTVVDTSSDGVTRESWKSCGSCHGTGTR
ncbi:hypothetical protein ACFYO0_14500 [Streptomyces sp. NPDC006365]|uniref:hypothetical protein n=1 Tax=Streptomyces sp. NPDC006365 TaxID=3364744 RepID=UPI0036A9E8AA